MKRLGPVSVLCLLASLALGTTASAADIFFPSQIKFKVRKGVMLAGSFNLSFADDFNADQGDRYQITLSDFEGLGFTSGQQFISSVFKADLALFGHMVIGEDGTKLREVYLDTNCQSAIGRETTRCFKYREFQGGMAGVPIQTEIFTPFKAIDLISSIFVATRAALDESFAGKRSYNFIFDKSTKQVTLVYEGSVQTDSPLGSREAAVLSLRHLPSNVELYKFYIGWDQRRPFPMKMLFVDDKGSQIEFIADEVKW